MKYLPLLLLFIPRLAFAQINVADYGATVYPCTAIGYVDSSTQVQAALNAAGALKTTLIWPAGVIRAANLTVPPNIINVGQGDDFNGACGTTIVGTSRPGLPVFVLAQGGPFEFQHMQVKASGSCIDVPHTSNSVTLEDFACGVSTQVPNVHFESTSNYPVYIHRSHFNGGTHGILADSHLGSLTIDQYAVFAGHTVCGVEIDSAQAAVSSQDINLSHVNFNWLSGPNLCLNVNVTHVNVTAMFSESSLPRLADIVFGAGYSAGHLSVDQSDLGINETYSIYNAPGSTTIHQTGLSHPVEATDASKVTFEGGDAGATQVVQ